VKTIDHAARESIKDLSQALRVLAGVLARCENRPETSEANARIQTATSAIDERLKDSK
jgi:hypothetical protein